MVSGYIHLTNPSKGYFERTFNFITMDIKKKKGCKHAEVTIFGQAIDFRMKITRELFRQIVENIAELFCLGRHGNNFPFVEVDIDICWKKKRFSFANVANTRFDIDFDDFRPYNYWTKCPRRDHGGAGWRDRLFNFGNNVNDNYRYDNYKQGLFRRRICDFNKCGINFNDELALEFKLSLPPYIIKQVPNLFSLYDYNEVYIFYKMIQYLENLGERLMINKTI